MTYCPNSCYSQGRCTCPTPHEYDSGVYHDTFPGDAISCCNKPRTDPIHLPCSHPDGLRPRWWIDANGPAVWCPKCGAQVEPPASDSHASVSPEQTPSPAADSAHSGDYVTNGEKP